MVELECACESRYDDETIFACCGCSEEELEEKRAECERDWGGWWICEIVSSCEEWEDLGDCDDDLAEELDCHD